MAVSDFRLTRNQRIHCWNCVCHVMRKGSPRTLMSLYPSWNLQLRPLVNGLNPRVWKRREIFPQIPEWKKGWERKNFFIPLKFHWPFEREKIKKINTPGPVWLPRNTGEGPLENMIVRANISLECRNIHIQIPRRFLGIQTDARQKIETSHLDLPPRKLRWHCPCAA